jgi:predicted alpha-1,2-mannosidase
MKTLFGTIVSLGTVGLLLSIFSAQRAAGQQSADRKPVDWVDPFIQSEDSRWFYFTAASRPFGMVNLSPDTYVEGAWNSGYRYQDSSIAGFSHLHAWQLGGISVMPTTGDLKIHRGSPEKPDDGYRSRFSHETETASPGYHALTLEDYQIRAELTSTTRVGLHRYTFEEGGGRLLFDLGGPLGPAQMGDAHVRRAGETEIAGYTTNRPTRRRPKPSRIYFVAQVSEPIQSMGAWRKGQDLGRREEVAGDSVGTYVRFDLDPGEALGLKVAISYVSVEQARNNLETELDHWDFDRVREEARADWNKQLSRVEIEGGTSDQKTKFYTDLFHVLKGRRIVTDVSGTYMDRTGPIPEVRRVPLGEDGRPAYNHYNTDAFWTSFWNLNLVWALLYPERMEEWTRFLVDFYENGGLIPRGPSGGNYTFVMVAAHSTPFLVGAYQKGIRNFDVETAYEGMVKNSHDRGLMSKAGYEHETYKGGGVEYYEELGWIPHERIMSGGGHTQGMGLTLEYAYDDWALAQMAKALGREEDYDRYMERAHNYQNVFDRGIGFMRPRNRDGSWVDPFSPLEFETGIEANAWVHTWFVPHDVQGLIELMGGYEPFVQRLDYAFTRARSDRFAAGEGQSFDQVHVNYANQPASPMAWLFNYAGAPHLSQKWVREVWQQAFSGTTPQSGYAGGDEDQGQQAGLSLLMQLGLFDVRGGAAPQPTYQVTAPLFEKITLHLNEDYYPSDEFVIEAPGASVENRYIQSATLDGEPLQKPWLYHRNVVNGGRLHFEVGSEPNEEWGSDPADAPPSMSDE